MAEHNEHQTFKTDEIPCQEISDPAVLLKNPLVSVKMITYNHEPYIAQAIEGVLIQKTDFLIELVIGEDCSTDRTREIVLEYQKKHPDIIRVVTSEHNVGMINNGLRTNKACRGKYIAFCEGDDYWESPKKLQIQVDFLENNPDYGLVHTDCNFFYVGNKKLIESVFAQGHVMNQIVNAENLNDDNAVIEILADKRLIGTLTVCVRKKLLDEVVSSNPECTDEKYLMGDLQRWIEIARISKVKYLPIVTANRNILPESASKSNDPQKRIEFSLSDFELRFHYLEKLEISNEECLTNVFKRGLRVLKACSKINNYTYAKRTYMSLKQFKLSSINTCGVYYLSTTTILLNYGFKPIKFIINRNIMKKYFENPKNISLQPTLRNL